MKIFANELNSFYSTRLSTSNNLFCLKLTLLQEIVLSHMWPNMWSCTRLH